MTWDKNKPLGSEPLRFGDNRIRELKSDLEDALKVEHHFPVDVNNVKLVPKIRTINVEPSISFVGMLYFNTLPEKQTFAIRTQTGWEFVSNNFNTLPSGTVLPCSKTAPFLQLVESSLKYLLKIYDGWIESVLLYQGWSYNVNSEIYLDHNHGGLGIAHAHSHSVSVYTPQAIGGDCDSGGISFEDDIASGRHKHLLDVTLHTSSTSHYHSVGESYIRLKHYGIEIRKVVY